MEGIFWHSNCCAPKRSKSLWLFFYPLAFRLFQGDKGLTKRKE